MTKLTASELEALLRDRGQWVPAEAIVTDLLAKIERLQTDNAALREIVDRLAHEDRYQAETGEGSMAYVSRLIMEARAWLDEHKEA